MEPRPQIAEQRPQRRRHEQSLHVKQMLLLASTVPSPSQSGRRIYRHVGEDLCDGWFPSTSQVGRLLLRIPSLGKRFFYQLYSIN